MGRLGPAEGARPSPSRGQSRLLPVLRAPGLQRDRDRAHAGGPAAHIETPLTLSIIGCVVTRPGEALMTDIGLTGGGNGRHMI